MINERKDFVSNIPGNLARRSFFLLSLYFAFAALVYLVQHFWKAFLPPWFLEYAFQIFLFCALGFLWIKGWAFKWKLTKTKSLQLIGLILVYIIGLKLLDIVLGQWGVWPLRRDLWHWQNQLLLQLLLAPFLEELLFRDYLFRAFCLEMKSLPRAILFSSAFFMLAHMSLYPGAFLLGVFSCLLYYYFESIIPCIAFHFLSNLSLYFIPYTLPHLYHALRQWGLYHLFYR